MLSDGIPLLRVDSICSQDLLWDGPRIDAVCHIYSLSLRQKCEQPLAH
jgi:hypothetical protein